MRPTKVFVVREGTLVDVTEAALAPPEPRVHLLGANDRAYDGLRSPTDGRDISSYSKHRRYMREKGLAHYSDFGSPGGFWDREAARRERVLRGEDPPYDKQLKARVVEADKRLEAGYKPRPLARVDHVEDYHVVKP